MTPSQGTSLRTHYWWLKEKKAKKPSGIEPLTSLLWDVHSTSVLQLLPYVVINKSLLIPATRFVRSTSTKTREVSRTPSRPYFSAATTSERFRRNSSAPSSGWSGWTSTATTSGTFRSGPCRRRSSPWAPPTTTSPSSRWRSPTTSRRSPGSLWGEITSRRYLVNLAPMDFLLH